MQDATAALAELRALRRRRQTEDIDRFEAFYRVYITAIFLGLFIFIASGRAVDPTTNAEQMALVLDHGAAFAGLIFVLACAGGMLSGADGGPLVIEAAEAKFALEAPIDRRMVLRHHAFRKLRFGCYIGIVAGGVFGILGYRRLPGGLLQWVASEALCVSLVTIGWNGCAMLFSGKRWRRPHAYVAGLLIVASSVIDVALQTKLAPGTLVGRIALWPLSFDPIGAGGVVLVIALAFSGVAVVGGTSTEAAQRRSDLVAGLRFSAFLGDIRTVVLTRRQLAHDIIRFRPLIGLRRSDSPGLPVWKRGWHGVLRWPARRFARMLLLGSAAGLSLVVAWLEVTPMIFVGGAILYVVGLEAVDSLGQETDHATFHESFPLPKESLFLRHLPLSFIMMLPATFVALGIAMLFVDGITLTMAAAIAVTAAMGGVVGAAQSTTHEEPALVKASRMLAPPEAVGLIVLGRLATPPLLATLGLVPLLAAREYPDAALPAALIVGLLLTVLVAVVVIVRQRFAKFINR